MGEGEGEGEETPAGSTAPKAGCGSGQEACGYGDRCHQSAAEVSTGASGATPQFLCKLLVDGTLHCALHCAVCLCVVPVLHTMHI